MSKERKPIKRSNQLAPLSREHHEGLLFCWKIRQGLQHKTPIETLSSYSLWFWHQHIKPHFFQEEKILLPYMPVTHPMAIQLKNEHAQIRELLLSIDKDTDQQTLQVLCDLIDKHIRFEERELFVYLEQLLTPGQLNEIQQQIDEQPIGCEADKEWKDVFWVTST